MKSFIFLFILLPTMAFTVSPKYIPIPVEDDPPKKVQQFEFYDQKNGQIYYETIPLLIVSKEEGYFVLSPMVVRDAKFNTTSMTLMVTYYPSKSEMKNMEKLNIDFLTINTLKQELSYPILFKQIFTNATQPQYRNIENLKSPALFVPEVYYRGYVHLFDDDISELLTLLLDSVEAPIDLWEPHLAEQRFNELSLSSIYAARTQNRNADRELFTQEREEALKFAPRIYDTFIVENPYRISSYRATSLLSQQRGLLFNLSTSDGEKSWFIPPTRLWVLTEMIELKKAIDKRMLPSTLNGNSAPPENIIPTPVPKNSQSQDANTQNATPQNTTTETIDNYEDYADYEDYNY